GLVPVADPLAQQRGVGVKALLVQPAQDLHGLVQGFAGHEAGSAQAHAVLADQAGHRPVLGGGQDQRSEHGVEIDGHGSTSGSYDAVLSHHEASGTRLHPAGSAGPARRPPPAPGCGPPATGPRPRTNGAPAPLAFSRRLWLALEREGTPMPTEDDVQRVGDVMARDVITVSPDERIAD